MGLSAKTLRNYAGYAKRVASGERAANAPDCPTPTAYMLYRGYRWSKTCDCASCTTRRAEFHASQRARVIENRSVDEVAVERAVAGDPPAEMTRGERLEVTRQLTARGASAREIALILRTTPRSVERYRAELRTASWT